MMFVKFFLNHSNPNPYIKNKITLHLIRRVV
jgi:hypothetical protein